MNFFISVLLISLHLTAALQHPLTAAPLNRSTAAPQHSSLPTKESGKPETTIISPGIEIITGKEKLITGLVTVSEGQRVAPEVQIAIIRDSDGYFWNDNNQKWLPEFTWNLAKIASPRRDSFSWQYSWKLPASDNDSFSLQARSGHGSSWDPTPATVKITVDNTAPQISNFMIASGATLTTTSTITLQNEVQGANQMRFSESTKTLTSAPFMAFSTESPFRLSPRDGQKIVYAQFKDNAGNLSKIVSDDILLDTQRPVVASTYPEAGERKANIAVMVTASFAEQEIDKSSINSENFYLKDINGQLVPAAIGYRPVAKTATLTPQTPLSYDSTYTAFLATGIKDTAGHSLEAIYSWNFKTVGVSTHPPGAPEELKVLADEQRNNLSWKGPKKRSDKGRDFNPPKHGGYNIYRSYLREGPYFQINPVLVTSEHYSDSDLLSRGVYYYLVRAIDAGGGEGPDSNIASNDDFKINKINKDISSTETITFEPVNGNVKLVVPPQEKNITLTFQTTEKAPLGIISVTKIYQLLPEGVTFSPPLTLTIKIPGNPEGARLKSFSKLSVNSSNTASMKWGELEGAYSYNLPEKTVTSAKITSSGYFGVINKTDNTPSEPPENLSLSMNESGDIQLSWQEARDLDSGISGYLIYRSSTAFSREETSKPEIITALPRQKNTFIDNTVNRGESYWYALSAQNGAGLESIFSNVESTTSLPQLNLARNQNPHQTYGEKICRNCHTLTLKNQDCRLCHNGSGSKYKFKNLYAHDFGCLPCHNAHSSGYPKMVRLGEENLCYKCHSESRNSVNRWNVKKDFSQNSRHAITRETAKGLKGAKVECTNCHSPHNAQKGKGASDPRRLANPFNTLSPWKADITDFCLTCHRLSAWPEATETKTTFIPYTISFPNMLVFPFFPGWDKSSFKDPSSGHQKYGCQVCHQPHGSPNPRLLAYFNGSNYETTPSIAREENLCYQCHRPRGPGQDVKSQFNKASKHPINLSNIHSDTETTSSLGFESRHGECSDCHDVHEAKAGLHRQGSNKVSGVLKGAIGVEVENGVAGTTPSYRVISPITREYQLCFKCHSSFVGLPAGMKDQSREFNPQNPSYHPVESTGTNPGIKKEAFIPPWDSQSLMYCSDCHSSDETQTARSEEVAGPHGSNSWPLLIDTYNPSSTEGISSAALCYRCHSYAVYVSGMPGSRFQDGHANHVGSKGYSCYSCHETHNSFFNPHLIRIKELGEALGIISFLHDSSGGSCIASCHNNPNAPYNYGHQY